MQRKERCEKIISVVVLLVFAVLGFAAQRAVPFMMDDEWYGTNLVTGESLKNFADVVQSQIWHFFHWGGRCITHGILQLTLMCGELGADILNSLMVFLLSLMVCVIARQKKWSVFLLVHAMIWALSANLKMSMLWQAGVVNYVYSSVWILLFMLPFLRALQEPEKKPLPFSNFWIIPLGIMASWSNENMGPVCFLLAFGTTVYLTKRKKKPIEGWMISGTLCSLVGSILVVAAPGNFSRSSALEKQSLYERFYSMLTAGVDYLFPIIFPMTILLLVKVVCLQLKMDIVQWALLIMAVLSYGAMVLSPHYPDRATFGTMILCIILTVSVISDIERENSRFIQCRWLLTACYAVCAIGKLVAQILWL